MHRTIDFLNICNAVGGQVAEMANALYGGRQHWSRSRKQHWYTWNGKTLYTIMTARGKPGYCYCRHDETTGEHNYTFGFETEAAAIKAGEDDIATTEANNHKEQQEPKEYKDQQPQRLSP
jgi:hypothetical protein